jgi:hypothetical protein
MLEFHPGHELRCIGDPISFRARFDDTSSCDSCMFWRACRMRSYLSKRSNEVSCAMRTCINFDWRPIIVRFKFQRAKCHDQVSHGKHINAKQTWGKLVERFEGSGYSYSEVKLWRQEFKHRRTKLADSWRPDCPYVELLPTTICDVLCDYRFGSSREIVEILSKSLFASVFAWCENSVSFFALLGRSSTYSALIWKNSAP